MSGQFIVHRCHRSVDSDNNNNNNNSYRSQILSCRTHHRISFFVALRVEDENNNFKLLPRDVCLKYNSALNRFFCRGQVCSEARRWSLLCRHGAFTRRGFRRFVRRRRRHWDPWPAGRQLSCLSLRRRRWWLGECGHHHGS